MESTRFPSIYDGLKLVVWMDDQDDSGLPDNLTVEATVKYSDIDKCWVAEFNDDD